MRAGSGLAVRSFVGRSSRGWCGARRLSCMGCLGLLIDRVKAQEKSNLTGNSLIVHRLQCKRFLPRCIFRYKQ